VTEAIRQSKNHQVNPHLKKKAKLSNNDNNSTVHAGNLSLKEYTWVPPTKLLSTIFLRVTRKWNKT
jgi:hypothetical protein